MRNPARAHHTTILTLLFAGACAVAWVWGQQRVDTRVGAVNTRLYGSGGGATQASVRYAQTAGSSVAMNSELRYEYRKSGALPSDVRMGYAALGPMHPAGPMAYIPSKPSYLQKPNQQFTSSPAPVPPSLRTSSYAGRDSVRYSTPSSSAVRGQSVASSLSSPRVSSALAPTRAANSTATGAGTIRYSR